MEKNFLRKTTESLKKGAQIGVITSATILPLKEATAQKTQKPILDDISIGLNDYKASDKIYHTNTKDDKEGIFDGYDAKGTGMSLGLTKNIIFKKSPRLEKGTTAFVNINSNKQTPYDVGLKKWWDIELTDNAKITADLQAGVSNPFNIIEPYTSLNSGFKYNFLNKDNRKIGDLGIDVGLISKFGKLQTPMQGKLYGSINVLPNLSITGSAKFAGDLEDAKSANYNLGLKFTFPSGEKATKYIKYKKPFNGSYKNPRFL